MAKRPLGRRFGDGETIVIEGEPGDCMYVIQSGEVEVLQTRDGREVHLTFLGPEEFFGEMALFTRDARSATVRAHGEATVLTVDQRTLLGRIQKDPSLAFRLIERMSVRLQKLDRIYSRVRANDRRNWETRPETYTR
jgi:CRP/FNR family transcriptional regulator, cyclic AMP receptor protein